jgi:hypothetical protein
MVDMSCPTEQTGAKSEIGRCLNYMGKDEWKLMLLMGFLRLILGAVYEIDSSPRIVTPTSEHSEMKPGTADPLLTRSETRDKTPLSKFSPRTPPPVYLE